jgi:hypothetical protein
MSPSLPESRIQEKEHMKLNRTAVLMLLVCCYGLAALAEDRPAPLLQADMEQDPLKLGWRRGGPISDRPVAE